MIPNLVFITGNQYKANNLSKYLGLKLEHKKLDLDEIQSLDLAEVVEHKARQAFELINSPVLVEDTSLEFCAFGKLPGTFIKFYLDQLSSEDICKMLNGFDRSAIARAMYGYCDGNKFIKIEGMLRGRISESPAEGRGYGWDNFFIPEGQSKIRSQMTEEEYEYSYTLVKPMKKLKEFLESLS